MGLSNLAFLLETVSRPKEDRERESIALSVEIKGDRCYHKTGHFLGLPLSIFKFWWGN
ncbi:MAG: hypothetical protein P5702_00215 [Limnospira sp. PMC 1291.21]|uniref:Uncharacterized protein n=1 Tax=Limnospira fusiformis PMC 851.14 TaxID=2219512 RepID=A0ABU9EIC4_LIMFS|nr:MULTISPECIES: hypothetical protein [Limnospira]EKD07449.1 hypothetical protein SPLC1_S411160 [Arthrospira platensis C1]MDC0839519.1 hypothetical protein [Limnoraphis robusta]MDT9314131.1 hypothetical protein [Limnospira sp. PMC 1306.21]MDY7052220.1 hypothetical protein [Limnospira fusiformis LS22]QJB25777.1 hypothetical protein HFV01_08195 [Limnospira fusiformis SAG 85.79]